jgi:hypothetical protein
MDKHERRRLARWESKKGRDQLKCEELMRTYSHAYALHAIRRKVEEWEPPHDVLFRKAEEFHMEPRIRRLVRSMVLLSDDEISDHVMGFRANNSRRGGWLRTNEDIHREVEIEKTWKQDVRAYQLAVCLQRHRSRTRAIYEELLVKTDRLRAIQACKLLKEEIMMAAWHPRRVEHILTTYGWEAYENLLGE